SCAGIARSPHSPADSFCSRPETSANRTSATKRGIPPDSHARHHARIPSAWCAVKYRVGMWSHHWVYRDPRSRWASAPQTTLWSEPHGPARYHEEEVLRHEVARLI